MWSPHSVFVRASGHVGWLLMAGALGLLAPVATGQVSSSVPELLVQAEQLRSELQWEEAIAVLREAVVRRAEDEALAAKAQVTIGRYLRDRNRLDDAEGELQRVSVEFGAQVEAVRWSQLYQIDVHQRRGNNQAAEAAIQDFLEATADSPAFQAWGKVQQAELMMASGFVLEALPYLQEIVSQFGEEHPEPANWARVRIAEILTDKVRWPEAIQMGDLIVAEHAAGRATDEQAAWGLLWKSRALERSELFNEAIEPAQMAAALADPKYPELVHLTEFQLGQIYSRMAGKLKIGWGALRINSMEYYGAALATAQAAGLGEYAEDWARLQCATEIRHLGMLERSLAWLRMGIQDPSQLSPMDEKIAERMSSFMTAEMAEAWHVYLNNPVNTVDPTINMVKAEFGQEAPGPTTFTLNIQSARRLWTGRMFEARGRLEEAFAAYRQAAEFGQTDASIADAYFHASRVCSRLDSRRKFNAPQEGDVDWSKTAREYADAALPYWTQVARVKQGAEAHEAIEWAVRAYYARGMLETAPMAADQIISGLGDVVPASTIAFAQFMKARALAWCGRWAEAIQAVNTLDQQFGAFQNSDIVEIRTTALCLSGLYHARLGDSTSGLRVLANLRASALERYYPMIDQYSGIIYRTASGQ